MLPMEREIYQRGNDELAEHYAMFVEWVKIPASSRNLTNMARRTGLPIKLISKVMRANDWAERALAYDQDSLVLRPDPRTMDEEAAVAQHLAASTIMLELGLTALQLKDPASIPVGKAIELVKVAAEMQRKVYGVADQVIKVTHEDMSRLNKVIDDIGILDAEVVEGGDDGTSRDPDDSHTEM